MTTPVVGSDGPGRLMLIPYAVESGCSRSDFGEQHEETDDDGRLVELHHSPSAVGEEVDQGDMMMT